MGFRHRLRRYHRWQLQPTGKRKKTKAFDWFLHVTRFYVQSELSLLFTHTNIAIIMQNYRFIMVLSFRFQFRFMTHEVIFIYIHIQSIWFWKEPSFSNFLMQSLPRIGCGADKKFLPLKLWPNNVNHTNDDDGSFFIETSNEDTN